MNTNHPLKPARAWAAEIVSAWVDNLPTQPIIDRVPEIQRSTVATLTQSNCRRIQCDARDSRQLDAAIAKLQAEARSTGRPSSKLASLISIRAYANRYKESRTNNNKI
jgi:hypothetical protein